MELDGKPIADLITGDATLEVFNKIYPDILTCEFVSEYQFILEMWSRYEFSKKSNNLDSHIFRALISVLFYKRKILPIHANASLNYLPNHNFNFVAYTEECGPIILSTQPKMSGRYKEVGLAVAVLRHVHRAAKSFLITLDAKEAKTVNKKIKNDLALGLDEVVVATAPEFNKLIKTLKSFTYIAPPKVDVLTSKRIIS